MGKIGVTPTLKVWLYQRAVGVNAVCLGTLRIVPAPVWRQTNLGLSPRAQS